MKRFKVNGASHGIEESLLSENRPDDRPILITGGAGFIGTNVADRILSAGCPVIIYDNVSRPGVEQNLQWLKETHGNKVQIELADIRDITTLRHVVQQASKVFHFAAQVAVTTSLTAPVDDFEINARGTLNLLETIRALRNPPPLIFTSTNKVYGQLRDVTIRENRTRYEPVDPMLRRHGIDEKRPLDFHSPYGCSKGAAEQYVLDYARTFKIPAFVLRMSCIYGLHQFGNEDQGWVAHFLIRALEGVPVTIYGDGKQVRDILFIDDLVNAFLLAHEHMGELSGRAFNIGGGANNTVSLLELLKLISGLNGRDVAVQFEEWRSADQLYYVSDIRRFSAITGWSPKVAVQEGVQRLNNWLLENRHLLLVEPKRFAADSMLLDQAKQMELMQTQRLNQAHEPRSKRLWREAKCLQDVLARTDGGAGR